MKARPKILVLAPDLPYPVRGGGQRRMTSILPLLAESAEVHLACTPRCPEEAAVRWTQAVGISIEVLPEIGRQGVARRLSRLRDMATLTNLEYRPGIKRRLDAIFQALRPELVWLETPYLLRYALGWGPALPRVVDYWGTSEGACRIWQLSAGMHRFPAWLRWRLAREGERRFAPKLSAIVCVSEPDAAYFRRLAPKIPVAAIPNVAEQPRTAVEIRRRSDPRYRMIFTGDMSYLPNVDAAGHFVAAVFPLVRSAVPQAEIVLAGRDPVQAVRCLAGRPGVTVTGEVPDLSEEIARSALYVLPMRLGSGIRSKLFEVFRLGVPIVTTAVGAEGLALVDGENCLMADSAEEFAAACIRLLRSPSERRRLGNQAAKLATQAYGPAAVRSRLERLLEAVGIPPTGRDSARKPAAAGRDTSRSSAAAPLSV